MFVSLRKYGSSRLSCCGCLFVCLLVSTIGCTPGKPRSAKYVDVTGKVTYQGKPVTGGQVTFFNEDGFNNNGVIDENGNYTISSPVGPVKIMVDNKMLKMGMKEAAKKGAGPRPGGEEPKPIKGKFVPLPDKYSAPDKTDLSYTVTNGPQTHDIELKD